MRKQRKGKKNKRARYRCLSLHCHQWNSYTHRGKEGCCQFPWGQDAKNKIKNLYSLSLLASCLLLLAAEMLCFCFPQYAMGHSACPGHPPVSRAADLALCHTPSLPASQRPEEKRPSWQKHGLLSASHWRVSSQTGQRLLSVQRGNGANNFNLQLLFSASVMSRKQEAFFPQQL